ncbi:MAG: type IX secretion system membrane protein PorP/SprF [Bacteroidota bacterium]
MKVRLLHIVLLIVLALPAFAQQDPMYSQYMFNRLVLNPAYAGARAQMSVVALARRQWIDIEGGPRSETFSVHTPTADERHGLGFTVVNDRVGFTSNTSVAFNYAYRIPMGGGNLALGLNFGMNSYWVRLSEVATWDPGDNAFNNGADFQRWQFVAGPGVYFQNQQFYLGASAPNIVPHRLYDPFYEELISADRVHYVFLGGVMLKLSRNIDFRPSFTLRATRTAPLGVDLSAAFLLKDRLWVGASFRPGNAWVFMTEIFLTKMIRLGYAYDYSLTEARSLFGNTHELMLGIDFGFARTKIISPKLF